MDISLGLSAVATGVDTITATYSPAPTLVDKKILFLRTAGTNTITAPTFSPNGLTAHTITKNNGDALAVGDLDGDVILMYDLANTNWELLNPKVVGGSGISGLTTSELVYGNSATTIASLPVATYPSLTELSYVKGVTSGVQTQLNAKKPDDILIREALGSTILASTIPIDRVTTAFPLTSQRQYFIATYLREGQTITGVKWFQDVQGNYVANNYNGVGLYSYSGGTLTLVASSTDDGNIWKATSGTMGSKAFSSTYVATSGLYYISALWSTSANTTAPSLGSAVSLRGSEENTSDFTNSAKISQFLGSRTSLIASQASSGTTAISNLYFLSIY